MIVEKKLLSYTDSGYAVSIGVVMKIPVDLQELAEKKEQILEQITQIALFRPGSLVERYRKCGKPYCHCSQPGERGHGPSYSLTRSVKGKTITKIIPKEEVEETKQQIQEYHRFQNLIGELVNTNETICDVQLEVKKQASVEAKKKG